MLTIKRSSLWGAALVVLSLSVALGQAQRGGSCPDIINRALVSLGDSCAGVGRNEACYGYDLVSAQFTVDVPEGFFSKPSDRASIFDIAKIQTAQLSVDERQWGIGLLNLQANVPNSLPGQAVTFILVGNVELENAVRPENAYTPADPIALSVLVNVGARSAPDTRSNVIASLSAGQAVEADGLSADGVWARVTVGERVGWVQLTALSAADLSALPKLDGTQRMPMQAFYLRTGIGAPECVEATNDVLLVQGPKNFKVDLTINGARMQLGSTVLYRIIDDGDTMEIIVIDGEVRVMGGGKDGQDLVITTGQRSRVCLDEPDNRGVDGESNDREVSCPFSEPEDVPSVVLGQDWCLLERVSPDVLNYPIDLECETVVEIQPTPRPTRQQPTPAPTLTATPSFVQNRCDPGGAWFGRCDHPNPAIRDWYYKAGWYFAQADAGVIPYDDIPPEFKPSTPEPNVEPEPFVIGYDCGIAMKVVWSGLPPGAVLDVGESSVNYYPSGQGQISGATSPSGTSGDMCSNGTYHASYTVSGSLSLSGFINGTCSPSC
ncbi:MAG: SH3 domain-containing protein [Anaerolineae bacterium]|nr:SH3 domain-containing protein [Anaerolineae bacterium]MDW8172908.1 SH3 domain-containing protein [Anaerolineae bacterium]